MSVRMGPGSMSDTGMPDYAFTMLTTVLVTTVTGGNPELLADTRNVLKIGGNWQPLDNDDDHGDEEDGDDD